MKHIKFKGDDSNALYASLLGTGEPIVMLHGGGPDRQSIIPFAKLLQNGHQVVFPDIRGYGQSICLDQSKHTWEQYAKDVISLIDYLKLEKIVISGMGLGSSIAERVAYSYPERVKAVILISPETLDKDGEGSSLEEIELIDKCAEVARKEGLEEAWKPFIANLTPVISSMVSNAISRTNPDSFAAAMSIGHSRRLESRKQLSQIIVATLVIPGNDVRHDSDIGEQYSDLINTCFLGSSIDWERIKTVDQFASNVVPQMISFLSKSRHLIFLFILFI